MAGASPIIEEFVELAGVRTFIRCTEGDGVPTLFVHGNPTSSADWAPFLEQLEGPGIAIDMPNFGRSERRGRRRFDAGMHGWAGFLGAAIDELTPGEFNLVVHDWGAVALHPAQRRSERLRRLVIFNAVPLLGDYRWHWIARIWRRRGLGELFNATTTRAALALVLRQARPGLRAMPEEFVDAVWDCWDREMARAVLDLYRSADPGALAAAGAHLERIDCPALILWGEEDPYVGPELAPRYAARLRGAEAEIVERAGHWPWIDRPELIGRAVAFLADRARAA